MSLDLSNFWDASAGTWTEIDSIPEGFSKFAGGGKQTSEYYTNNEKTTVVRVSDHWGSGIRECNWYLSGYKRNNSFNWPHICGEKRVRIGIIDISKLVDIRGV